MIRGNNPDGKHDERGFARLNIAWVGTVLDRTFWIGLIIRMEIFRVEINLGGNFSDRNCPCGSYPGC